MKNLEVRNAAGHKTCLDFVRLEKGPNDLDYDLVTSLRTVYPITVRIDVSAEYGWERQSIEDAIVESFNDHRLEELDWKLGVGKLYCGELHDDDLTESVYEITDIDNGLWEATCREGESTEAIHRGSLKNCMIHCARHRNNKRGTKDWRKANS